MSAKNAVQPVFFQIRPHFLPVFLLNPFLGLICLKNEGFEGFEAVQLASFQLGELLLVTRFYRHERVLHFLEFVHFKRAVGKGGIEPVNLGFDLGQFAFDSVNLRLLLVRGFGLPCFDAGGEFLEPLIRNRSYEGVPFHLGLKDIITDKSASVGVIFLILVGATIVIIFAPIFLPMALARDAKAARATRREVEEQESFFRARSSPLSNSDKGGLNVVPRLFRDHGNVDALMKFALVEEHPVIKWAGKHIVD